MEEPTKPTQVWIQGLIWNLEESAGPVILKALVCLLAFVVLAFVFNYRINRGFSNSDAMESAQLGRHLAAWRGYTTFSIRPSAIGLLQRAHPDTAKEVLRHPVPDLSIAPGYPFVLACAMKVLPFDFATTPGRFRVFQPETWIIVVNDALFLAAIFVAFRLARRLFDVEVAWISAVILGGSEIYWKFSGAGLSTIWLALIFLTLTWCLVVMEERESREPPAGPGGSMALAAATGALAGIGGLSRYSFALVMLPALLFIGLFLKRDRAKLFLLTAAAFAVVMAPWIARNLALSHTPFGTAGYALLENTRPFEEDRLERAFDPFAAGLSQLGPWDVVRKFLMNGGKILRDDLPRLGSNWAWSFFLCSLLLPYQKEGLRRMRYFVLGNLALLAVAQALGQTHLSSESPEINSENLLVLAAPLVVIFGTGFFFTLLDQIAFPSPQLRKGAAVLFGAVMIAPLLVDLVAPAEATSDSPYFPSHIQSTAAMLHPDELMISDIPWAVAWYGERPCAWLPLNAGDAFDQLEQIEPIHALFLTQLTTDRRFLSEVLDRQHSWEHFTYDAMPESDWPKPALPHGFPLSKALLDYMPAQVFLADKIRWKTGPGK